MNAVYQLTFLLQTKNKVCFCISCTSGTPDAIIHKLQEYLADNHMNHQWLLMDIDTSGGNHHPDFTGYEIQFINVES